MQLSPTRLQYLWKQYLDRNASPEELQELTDWLTANGDDGPLQDVLEPLLAERLASPEELAEHKAYVLQKVRERITLSEEQQPSVPSPERRMHRIHFLKTAWFKYAAAILLVLAAATTYFFIYTPQPRTKVVQNTPPSVPNDVLPGSDRAVLTLSNGQQVQLNNATSETINDGTLSIENNNGQLVYQRERVEIPYSSSSPRLRDDGKLVLNTMQTPKGGQYKLTLADGTKVWLNAASGITYPTTFKGKTREVSISGEAYFEVAKDKSKPFIVQAGTIKTEVLGTHFNAYTYTDEKVKTITLLEGSVKVIAGNKHAILKPGEQALAVTENIDVNKSADLEQVIAWKNGLFKFNRSAMPEVMQQLSRWYDVEVVYEGEIPDLKFAGKMQRSLNLSQVLEILERMGVKFRIEGKKLIVEKPKLK